MLELKRYPVPDLLGVLEGSGPDWSLYPCSAASLNISARFPAQYNVDDGVSEGTTMSANLLARGAKRFGVSNVNFSKKKNIGGDLIA